jgi:hypothetical protein
MTRVVVRGVVALDGVGCFPVFCWLGVWDLHYFGVIVIVCTNELRFRLVTQKSNMHGVEH